MNALVSELLDFARTPNPKKTLTSVEKLFSDVLDRITVPKNVEVETKLDSSLPVIEVDPFLMERVLTNIIGNAVQAMPEGGTLGLVTQKNAQNVTLEVGDTGVGIPPEDISKLFEPLFSTKPRGVGLGLAIVKSIIDAHGGTISVKSDVGLGTTFCIALPLSSGNVTQNLLFTL
jgi:signal transduction histidine kinase